MSKFWAIFFHTLEQVVAGGAPFLINWLADGSTVSRWPWLAGVSVVLVIVLKSLRENGILPDYAASTPSPVIPVAPSQQ
jgi:hypothetical protein